MKLFCSLAYLATTNYTAFLRFWLREKRQIQPVKWNCIFEHVFEYFVWSLVSSVFCVCLQSGKKRLHVDQHHPNHHHQAPLFKIHLWFGPYIHDTYITYLYFYLWKRKHRTSRKGPKKPMKKLSFSQFSFTSLVIYLTTETVIQEHHHLHTYFLLERPCIKGRKKRK